MKKYEWFKVLPVGLALRLYLLYTIRKLLRLPVRFSFSQGAEDLVFEDIIPKSNGFYVDVGCNEPVRFSNTFGLYLKGWRGITVDANKHLIEKFKTVRSSDVAICEAVSDGNKFVVFHRSTTSAVSTISEERLRSVDSIWEFKSEDQVEMRTRTLTQILDSLIREGTSIDLLSIDVEGHDCQVLRGLDLMRYKPKVIIVELTVGTAEGDDIRAYLLDNGYKLLYFCGLSAFFITDESHSAIKL
jgi:FkbM family methyltransferase